MFKRIRTRLVMISLVGLGSVLFSGCTNPYSTLVAGNHENTYIHADQDSTMWHSIRTGGVMRTNYMYSFAIAATATKDAGYTYFSIIAPKEIVEQYKIRNVQTVQDAYDACDGGEGSFTMAIWDDMLPLIFDDSRCDSIVSGSGAVTFYYGASMKHRSVSEYIRMHNNEPEYKMLVSFNAQDVLNSEVVKGLDPEYFRENHR